MTFTPDDFPKDPLGFGGNQAGHVMIGAVTAMMIMTFGASDLWAFWTTFAIWGVAWEAVYQWRILGASRLDSATDAAFNMAGATYIWSGGAFWWLAIPSVAIAIGAWRRAR